MSLKNLQLVSAAPTRGTDAKQRGREKVLAYIADQKALVAAETTGGTYAPTRTVRRKNEAGDSVRIEAPRHVRRGWFNDASGKLVFQLRYGAKPLELGKGVNAVAVSTRDELPAVLDTIAAAVSAGELDQQIASMAAERRANFKRKKAG